MAILVDLAEDADWRRAVARNAVYLSQSAIQQLMEILRSSNHSQQTAAAFLIAAIPGPQVDWAMAEMIVGGRSRQAAYLVLLSRNTPDAKLFLARAESRVELRPALVSARMHFEKFQFQLQEWIAASKGDRDESYETGQLPTDQTPKRSGIPLGHLAVRVAVRPTNG
jgi:hypothetical protein